jgi:hypothetical protein
MRTLGSALLLAATFAVAAVGPTAPAAAAPAPCADNAECWRGPYTKTGKKPIKVECCEQMEGSILCTKVGDDDALVEFGPGDCRYSKNRKGLKCEKACGSGCAHKFDGSR